MSRLENSLQAAGAVVSVRRWKMQGDIEAGNSLHLRAPSTAPADRRVARSAGHRPAGPGPGLGAHPPQRQGILLSGSKRRLDPGQPASGGGCRATRIRGGGENHHRLQRDRQRDPGGLSGEGPGRGTSGRESGPGTNSRPGFSASKETTGLLIVCSFISITRGIQELFL